VTPIPLIIDAMCEAAGTDRVRLAHGRRLNDAYARNALAHLLTQFRDWSIRESLAYCNYAHGHMGTHLKILQNPRTQAIIREAKWLVEQRDRPVGDNFRWEWPR